MWLVAVIADRGRLTGRSATIQRELQVGISNLAAPVQFGGKLHQHHRDNGFHLHWLCHLLVRTPGLLPDHGAGYPHLAFLDWSAELRFLRDRSRTAVGSLNPAAAWSRTTARSTWRSCKGGRRLRSSTTRS